MRLLKSSIHSDISHLSHQDLLQKSIHRKATRAIILDGQNVLLLYTERYHDYSLPGGGLNPNEDIQAGLIRELEEETGAQEITILSEFGQYEEFRPWYKDNAEVLHMDSFCYLCRIHSELSQTKLEPHEISNGMRPVWINIHDAILHNEETIANSPKKGMSIERETFLLKLIVKELL